MTDTDLRLPQPRTLADEVRLTRLPPPAVRRAIRDGAGISLRRFARAIGVSHGSVAYYERGGTPAPEIAIRYRAELEQLAEVIGMDIADASTPVLAAQR